MPHVTKILKNFYVGVYDGILGHLLECKNLLESKGFGWNLKSSVGLLVYSWKIKNIR